MKEPRPADGDAERKVVEVRARTVDEAVARGLVRLGGLSRSEVKIEVLKEGRSGLLGFGAEEAVVRLTALLPGERGEDAVPTSPASPKSVAPTPVASRPGPSRPVTPKPAVSRPAAAGPAAPRPAASKPVAPGPVASKPAPGTVPQPPARGVIRPWEPKPGEIATPAPAPRAKPRPTPAPAREPRPRARPEPGTSRETRRPGGSERGQSGEPRPAGRPERAATSTRAPRVRPPVEPGADRVSVARSRPVRDPSAPVSPEAVAETEALARAQLEQMLGLLGYENVTIERTDTLLPLELEEEQSLVLTIRGKDVERLLADEAQPLLALQFLVRLGVSRHTDAWANLLLDVNGDRARRVKELFHLSEQSADLVERDGSPVSLPPMTAYERRVVHLALRDHPTVATQSIGAGDRRKVTVRLKGQLLPDV